jgi:predicted GNAT family acetyltransferase
MVYTEHSNAESFLATARASREQNEAANGLMLGICLRLLQDPEAYGSTPYLATVGSAEGPRLVAVMTPPRKLLLHSEGEGAPAGLELLADGLLRGNWPVPGVMAAEAAAEAFADIWSDRTGASCRQVMRQRVYELREVAHPTYPPGRFEPATAGKLELVRRWAHAFHDACIGDGQCQQTVRNADGRLRTGNLFLWVDGVPRSMAARTRPLLHGESISLVFTPPEHRRKGYATAVVASLSQLILDEGKQFCTLYADLKNPASNSIYRRIGYRGVADVIELEFEGGPTGVR